MIPLQVLSLLSLTDMILIAPSSGIFSSLNFETSKLNCFPKVSPCGQIMEVLELSEKIFEASFFLQVIRVRIGALLVGTG